MVVKRQCSFCAGEVEPGTGTMFVKRDGSVFYFCSSSCRKQQLHLGRVGHRLKWTRAHAVKRAQQQSTSQRTERAAPRPAPAVSAPRPKRAEPSVEKAPAPAPAPAAPAATTPAAPPTPAAAEAAPTKTPAKRTKAPAKDSPKKEKSAAPAEKT